jgi:nucleolar protein 56
VKSSIGIFLFEDNGDLTEFMPFVSDEEAVEELMAEEVGVEFSSKGYEIFWSQLPEIMENAPIDYGDYLETRRRVAIKVAREMLNQSPKEDAALIHAIDTLRDVNRSLNILSTRLIVNSSAFGLTIKPYEAEKYREVLESLKVVSYPSLERFSSQIENLIEYKEGLEGEIEELMSDIAPNTSGLIGPILGAKLISLSKGIERLARMPASRIQVLGAQKAMLRHRKDKAKSPKHGIIFQLPTISKSPWWQRGKIARSLAAKIAIAARLDAFKGENRSQTLKDDFMKRYREIKATYTVEPKKMRIIKTPRDLKKQRKR